MTHERPITALRCEATLDQAIARRLTRVRESAQLTLQELAMLTGIPEEILAEGETGSEPISLSRLRTIAIALDMNAVALMTRLLFAG